MIEGDIRPIQELGGRFEVKREPGSAWLLVLGAGEL